MIMLIFIFRDYGSYHFDSKPSAVGASGTIAKSRVIRAAHASAISQEAKTLATTKDAEPAPERPAHRHEAIHNAVTICDRGCYIDEELSGALTIFQISKPSETEQISNDSFCR